jgi:hypothetical protein
MSTNGFYCQSRGIKPMKIEWLFHRWELELPRNAWIWSEPLRVSVCVCVCVCVYCTIPRKGVLNCRLLMFTSFDTRRNIHWVPLKIGASPSRACSSRNGIRFVSVVSLLLFIVCFCFRIKQYITSVLFRWNVQELKQAVLEDITKLGAEARLKGFEQVSAIDRFLAENRSCYF